MSERTTRTLSTKFQAQIGAEKVLLIEDPGLTDFGITETVPEIGRVVRVRKDLPPASKGTTVLHEFLHVAALLTHTNLSETAVHSLEFALTTLLRSNPAMARWMLKNLLAPNTKHREVYVVEEAK